MLLLVKLQYCTPLHEIESLLCAAFCFARQAKLAADFEQITSWARHARYADVETAMNQVSDPASVSLFVGTAAISMFWWQPTQQDRSW